MLSTAGLRACILTTGWACCHRCAEVESESDSKKHQHIAPTMMLHPQIHCTNQSKVAGTYAFKFICPIFCFAVSSHITASLSRLLAHSLILITVAVWTS